MSHRNVSRRSFLAGIGSLTVMAALLPATAQAANASIQSAYAPQDESARFQEDNVEKGPQLL